MGIGIHVETVGIDAQSVTFGFRSVFSTTTAPTAVQRWMVMGMADNINLEAVTAEQQINKKIKAFNPQIVVSDSPDKPYYSISYYDIAKKEWYIGYSSYYLKNVYKWLFECFEEVDCDMVEVVRCKDCKYYELDEGDMLGECHCKRIPMNYSGELYPERDYFCAYGERK